MPSRSTVTDLGEFYRSQGAKAERERIVEWLGQVDTALAEQAAASEDDNEKIALAGSHETILALVRALEAE